MGGLKMKNKNNKNSLDKEVKDLKKEVQEMKTALRDLIQFVFKDDDEEDEFGPFSNN
ncbi:MAG: hypothetical protein QXZ12_03445 [Thermoplasmata archaeon]